MRQDRARVSLHDHASPTPTRSAVAPAERVRHGVLLLKDDLHTGYCPIRVISQVTPYARPRTTTHRRSRNSPAACAGGDRLPESADRYVADDTGQPAGPPP